MGAVATIALNDGLATPVSHSFIPLYQDKGVWWFEDQSASTPLGYNRLSIQFVRAGNPAPGSDASGRVNRVKIGFHCPRLATLGTNDAGLTPPPTVQYVNRSMTEFIISDQSTAQEREDIRLYTMNVLANASLVSMIESLQGLY